jgi:hypothetical protein
MKTLVILFTSLFLTNGLSILGETSANYGTRIHSGEDKDAERIKKYHETEQLLDSMNFIVKAYYLDNERGRRVIVSPNLNFIEVLSNQAVLQTGSNVRIGANGVGGTTAKGSISHWKLIKNEKKKYFTVTFSVMSSIGFYDVIMNINGSGKSTAIITGLGPGRLEYQGDLVPLEQNAVYQGHSL